MLILLCFLFLFFVVLNVYFFQISAVNENTKLNLVLAVPTRALLGLANKSVETPPLAADKTMKVLS